MGDAAEDSGLAEAMSVLTAWERHFAEPTGASGSDAAATEGETLTVGVRGAVFAAERFVIRCETARVSVDAEVSLGVAFAPPDAVERARGDALAVVRAALAALRVEASGRDWLPNDPASRLRIWADDDGTGYAVVDGEGGTCAGGDGWAGLVRLLEADADVARIWV